MNQTSLSVTSAQKTPHFIPIIWEGDNDPPSDLPEIPPMLEIGFSACVNAVVGGLNGMVKEGVRSYEELSSGKLDQKQYTYRVVRKGSEAAAKSGGKTIVALSLKEGFKIVAKKVGSETLRRMARSHAMTSVCFGLVDQGADTYQYMQGTLDEVQYKINTSENVGGTGGAISGAAVGALLGSVVPGLGTGAGFLLGSMVSMLGAAGGAAMGKSLGESWFRPEETESQSEEPPADA